MPTREIAHEEWVTFFDGFSQQHQGWLVTIEVLDPDLGAQVEAQELELRGITADSKESVRSSISINVGRTPWEHVTHTISDPSHVRLKQTEEGANEALEIESAGGTITLVHFRSAVLPEMVDGVVLERGLEGARDEKA
jgi:uncharacterized protein DUF5335